MISLRDVQLADKEKVRQWRNMWDVSKYMYTDHYITHEEHEKWFQITLTHSFCKYWIIVCDDEDVGLANIYNLDHRHSRCYWAFYIASSNVRGKGVGSFVEYSVLHYVFDELKLNKLCCEVIDFNEQVINMHKKFGFKQEGLFRKHVIKENRFADVVSLAMLKSEWEILRDDIESNLKKKGILSIS